MFKDTKAFSGFSVNDVQKAKEFYYLCLKSRNDLRWNRRNRR